MITVSSIPLVWDYVLIIYSVLEVRGCSRFGAVLDCSNYPVDPAGPFSEVRALEG